MDEGTQFASTRYTLDRKRKRASSKIQKWLIRTEKDQQQRQQARELEDERIKEERKQEDAALLAEKKKELDILLAEESIARTEQVVSLVLPSPP